MAVKDITTTQVNALVGTRDAAGGFEYPASGLQPWFNWLIQSLAHLGEALFGNLQVKEDDANTTTIRILAGRVSLGGVTLVYAGGTVDLVAFNNDTAYVWLHDAVPGSGVATIGTGADSGGWPTSAHIKLAEVTLSSGAITAVLDRRHESALKSNPIHLSVAALGTWAIDGDGARTNGGGVVGDVALTEAAAAFSQVWDESAAAYLQLSGSSSGGGYTNDYQLLPDTPAVDDAAYFGHTVPFCEIALDVATAGAYSGDSLTWEYWDGSAWQTLTLVQDQTDTTAGDGKRSFQQDGAVHFIPPSDWASTTVNSQAAYWVRARVSTANVTTAATTNSVEHELVAPEDGFTAPLPMTVTGVRASDGATGTLHAANPIKFIVMNFTSGAHSGELTWATGKRSDSWSGLSVPAALGDVLGVVVTQEDGTNEVINAVLGLTAHAV